MTSKLTATQLMNNMNKTTQPDLTATFANLKIDKDQQQQQQQQPRFIRKKPQVIQSIEHFSQEILMNQVQTSPEVEEQERRQPDGEDAIQVIMEQLKKQKIEEIMQRTIINPPFSEEEIKVTGSRVQSPNKTKEIDITIRSDGGRFMQPQLSMSPEQRNQSKGRQESQRPGSAQTLEELKQKKIEELTQMLIQEQRSSRQSYHAFMSQPYATTVSHPQIVEEEDCRSESTVQYQLDESAAKSSIQKGQSPQKRAPSPQNTKPALKQPAQKEVQRPKSAMFQEKPLSKVVQSKVTAIKEQVQQTKSKLTKVNESRNKAQPLAVEKKQFATQTPSLINNIVSHNQQTTTASTNTKDLFKTTMTSSFINQVPEQSNISIPSNTSKTTQPHPQQTLNQLPPLHQLEFYNDSQRAQQFSHQQQISTSKQQNSNIQLSEKTLQIVFKKLQKDCENAIRQADREEKGSLTMEQLKNCFFLLDYLPCMQIEEQESINQQQIHAFFGYRQNISTKKSLVMQEKEFVYNFWCIINPLNNAEISNALVYDMFLLLIYNVQQSLQTSTEYLNEYLENFYRETNIDIDRFANYNSGNSGQHDNSPQRNDQFSNLNKYLSQCNLWSVERLAFEFRQIHANRLSHLFSHSQQSKKEIHSGARTSLSPLAFQSPHMPSIIVNPADGRKYKKAVIEEHLSNMTFSPKINLKTNQLDQRLTHRLMQRDNSNNRDNSSRQQVQRDASVDALLSQANGSRVHNSQFMLNLEPVDANGIFTGACPSFKRYDLLLYRQQMTQDKIGRAQEGKLMKQMEECTFKPNLRPHSPSFHPTLGNAKSYQNLKTQTEKVFRDITQRVKDQRSKLLDPTHSSQKTLNMGNMTREEKELQNCTFHPKINTTSMRRQENESIAANSNINSHPKGYYEMINRMRKVNEEKRAIEEKIHKKAIGENYDKAKLMNIKPPSFVAGQRVKKKLIMYIDVNITPTRTGRIGIYEGDDVRELAKNFKKTFQLNSTMQALLTQQLEHHLQLYKEKNGMTEVQGSVFPPESNESPDTDQQHQQLDPYMMMNTRGGGGIGRNPMMMQSNSSSQTFDGLNLGRPTRSAYLLDNIDEEESKSLQNPIQTGFNKRSLEIPDKQYMPMTLTNETRLGGGLTFGQIFSNAHKSYQQQQSSSSGGNLEQNDAHFYENDDAHSSSQQQQQMDLNQEYQRLTAGGGGSASHRRRGADHLDCLIASESDQKKPQLPAELKPGFYGLPNSNPITDFQQFSLQNKNESFF